MQSHGDGWRARKKHAGQWFRGPVRDSVQEAEEDAQKFEEASAVSLEALQAMQRNLTSVNAAEQVWLLKNITLAGVCAGAPARTGVMVPLERRKPKLKKMLGEVLWLAVSPHKRRREFLRNFLLGDV